MFKLQLFRAFALQRPESLHQTVKSSRDVEYQDAVLSPDLGLGKQRPKLPHPPGSTSSEHTWEKISQP